MSKNLCWGVVAGLALWVASGHAHADPRRFAVFVGSNVGDNHEPILRHAEDDAVRVAQTLRALGDFPGDQVLVLNGATASELRDAVVRLNVRVREQRDAVLFLFYSGHADAESLHLGGTHLPLAELKALLVGSPATSRVLVVDACQSGSLIGVKGARPVPSFEVSALDQPAPEGFAVLTSATASENAQESAALHGSFFTYFLNSGLMGAADQNHDGAVTLSELYAFSSSETRTATVSSPAGPQTPTFQFMLGGRHDLVLTRPGRRDTRMGELAFAEAGRFVVQQWDGALLAPPLAELASHEPGARLTLPPGRYHVTRRGQREIAEQDVNVAVGETAMVNHDGMSRVDPARVVRKGGERRSATGFAVLGGWRTDELGSSSEPQLSVGSGPMLLVMLRHDRRWLSLEARAALESETSGNAGLQIRNRGLSLAAAALHAIDLSWVTLSLGGELGWVLLRQEFSLTSAAPSALLPEESASLPSHWSDGIEVGPLAQLDLPWRGRAYLRLEVGGLFRGFRAAPAANSWQHGIHLHVLAGGGVSF